MEKKDATSQKVTESYLITEVFLTKKKKVLLAYTLYFVVVVF